MNNQEVNVYQCQVVLMTIYETVNIQINSVTRLSEYDLKQLQVIRDEKQRLWENALAASLLRQRSRVDMVVYRGFKRVANHKSSIEVVSVGRCQKELLSAIKVKPSIAQNISLMAACR